MDGVVKQLPTAGPDITRLKVALFLSTPSAVHLYAFVNGDFQHVRDTSLGPFFGGILVPM